MKKILLPTDFSKNSYEVIAFALEAFNDEPCVFYFIHATQFDNNGLGLEDSLQNGDTFFEERNTKVFQKMVNQVSFFAGKEEYSKHFLKLICKNAELIEGMKTAINNFDIDIVLVGTSEDNSANSKQKGKNVNAILNEIKDCPVMAVPLAGEAWKSMDENTIEFTR